MNDNDEQQQLEQEEEEEEALPSSPIGGSESDDDEALPKSPVGGGGGDSDDDDDDDENENNNNVWEKHETDDGQVYYHNTETDETTWDVPEGYNQDEDDTNNEDVIMEDADESSDKEETTAVDHDESQNATTTTTDEKKNAWEQVTDEQGNVYYYNSQTEVTQWEKPEDFDKTADTAVAVSAAANGDGEAEVEAPAENGDTAIANNGWEMFQDDDGNVYYFNNQTEETQWHKPDGFDDSAVAVEASQKQKPDNEFSSSPPSASADGAHQAERSWEKYKDDEGRIYYYNTTTEETQWEAPEGFVEKNNDDEDDYEEKNDEFQASPVRPPSPMEDDNSEENDDERATKKEEEKEPEPEIDPVVKRVMDAEEALNKPDSVLEPGCTANVLEVVASQDGNPEKAILALIDNFHGETAICGTLAKWLADLRSASSNNSNVNEVVGTARQSVADEIRDTTQDVISLIAKERFPKTGGDSILNLSKSEAAFLEELIESNRWRKLLIDLSATNKDSALLMYCIRTISKRGYHRELVKRMNPSEYFSVFNAMLQSELAVVGKAAISASSEMDTSIGLDELVNDLRRTCTATAFTYLYSIEVLRHLVEVAEKDAEDHPKRDPARFRRAIRKWERLSQDLDSAMVDPNLSSSTAGSSPLFRKRRLEVALAISELHQRQRRRLKPLPGEEVVLVSTNGEQKQAMETGLLNFLRRYSVGTQVDDRVLDSLIPTGLNMQAASDQVGELLITYPLTIRALIHSIFKTGLSKGIPASTKSKCARLVALAVLAGEKKARAEIGERSVFGADSKESPDEVALTRMLLQGAQLCEEVFLMAAFAVTSEGEDQKGPISPGQQLCNLALKCAPVAQGVMMWARDITMGNEYTSTATYATFSPSILSLVRIIALRHPCTRSFASEIAFAFLKHSTNSEMSYKKINQIKEQALRLLLFLLVRGEAPSVLRTLTARLQQADAIKLDASLLRYFIAGILEVVKPPFSLPFVRLLGAVLKTPRCIEAVQSAYFGDTNQERLKMLLNNFKESCALKDSAASKVDFTLVTFLSKTYSGKYVATLANKS